MIVESFEDVILLSGTLFSNQWESLHTAISLSLKRHHQGVIIDCSGLNEINVAGAGTFQNVLEYLEAHDGRIILSGVQPGVMEVLKSVEDVRSQLPMVETLEEARKSLYFFTEGEFDAEKQTEERSNAASHNYRFLVVLNGTACDRHVLVTAREMADSLDAYLHVVFPLLVPRELPLQSPLPEVEETARKSLQTADELLVRDKLDHEIFVTRARDIASSITDALEEHESTHVILGLPDLDAHDAALKTVRSVMAAVTHSALIFVRGPLS